MGRKIRVFIILFLIIISGGIIVYNRINMNNEKKNGNTKTKIKKEIIQGDGDYKIKLLKAVNSSEKNNYLISPYSIRIALNMLADGADAETKREILNLVGNDGPIITPIKGRLNVANALFLKDKYEKYINKDFIKDLENEYDANVLVDEFKTPKVINDWVNEKTYKMIPVLLNNIPERFVLGLANSIALDVEWDTTFDCYATHKAAFTKIDNTSMDVSMMSNSYKYGIQYFMQKDYQGVILPYISYNKDGKKDYKADSHFEFIGIMPNNSNIKDFISNLPSDFLDTFDDDISEVSNKNVIDLYLPVFSYDYDLSNFKDILKDLGIKKAFNPDKAEFYNIITKENREKYSIDNIYVDEAIHKTHIELNESGTKAAAVTYFGMLETASFEKEEPKVIEIKFNKPFLYLIRDSKSKEILFLGTVYEPNKYKENTCDEK